MHIFNNIIREIRKYKKRLITGGSYLIPPFRDNVLRKNSHSAQNDKILVSYEI